MRTFNVLSISAVLVSLFFAAPSQAYLLDTMYIDFSGWDATLIDNGVGQTFADVFPSLPGPPVDVFVQATGDFSRESRFRAGFIDDALLRRNEADNFMFTFSRSLPNLVVKMVTVDSREAMDVVGDGPEAYFHNGGAFPNIIDIDGGNGLAIIGNGIRQDPLTGASSGEITTGAQMGVAVLVRHRNLENFVDKFEFFNVGVVVPEPTGFSLFGFSLFGFSLLGLRNRG